MLGSNDLNFIYGVDHSIYLKQINRINNGFPTLKYLNLSNHHINLGSIYIGVAGACIVSKIKFTHLQHI